jgi:hypothetical protein
MAAGSQDKLTAREVEAYLVRLRKDIPRPECWLCECVQGFRAQLELDAVDDAKSMLVEHKRSARQTRRYPGCESCPPAALFAEYLMRKRGR